MDIIKIKASSRATGKTASKAVRNSKSVPCVLYGHDSETVHFQVPDLTLRKLVYTSEVHRLSVDVDGELYDCILKDVDFHPIKDSPIHADFQLLKAGEKIELSVPIKFVGKSKGQTDGGDLQLLQHEIIVSVLPENIPDSLEVNITELEIGDTLHMSDLAFPDVEIVSPPQQSVVAVTAKKIAEEPEAEVVEGEEGEAVEGEAGEGDQADGATE